MKVHSNRSVRRAKVIPDGKNLVSHAGAALLAELADRSGLTEAMSVAMEDCGISWHTHDPGVVLTHLAVAIADGADCLADIAVLKEQEDLFGPVASVATAWRAVHATASVELRAIPVAMATARARVWAAHPPEGPMIWDFDSTLLNVHAEKEDAAATYKHGFGFNPLAAWCDNTNEPLAAMLRPGNAAPGNTDDHLELHEQVVRAVPAGTRSATKKVTIPPWCATRSWSGPTRLGPPIASSNPSPMPTSTTRSAFPSAVLCETPSCSHKKRTGWRPPRPAEGYETAPR